MNDDQKEILRDSLLGRVHASGSVGLPVRTLRLSVKQDGFDLDEQRIGQELHYLLGKGFVTVKRSALAKGVARYVITSEGTDYLEQNGLA